MKYLTFCLGLVILFTSTSYSQTCVTTIPNADWDNLSKFKPAQIDADNAKTRGYSVRSIFDASSLGDLVNLDYWGITISKMPMDGGMTLQPQELLNRIRLRFSSYLDREFARFSPLEDADQAGWRDGISGTLLMFNAHFPIVPGPGIDRLAPVMLSEVTPTYWRFVTVGDHPVSGTREFGIRQRPDQLWEIYTRGADRITFSAELPIKDGIFSGADQLWEAFQDKVAESINSLGGVVSDTPSSHSRYCWASMLARVSN